MATSAYHLAAITPPGLKIGPSRIPGGGGPGGKRYGQVAGSCKPHLLSDPSTCMYLCKAFLLVQNACVHVAVPYVRAGAQRLLHQGAADSPAGPSGALTLLVMAKA